MNELTRQYDSPKSVSASTSSLIKQFNPNLLQGNTDTIPETQDLISIKSDLQTLLPFTESRVKDLKKSMHYIEKTIKIRDAGKNVNGMNKTSSRQGSVDDLETIDTTIPKNDSVRQAALETIRRKKRRDEAENSDESNQASPFIKLKKLEYPAKGVDLKTKNKKSTESVDFVRVKPKDQIPTTTFWSAMEPYFRPLTEEDREFLLQKSDQGKPYLIPPLGQHYLQTWAEEDQHASIESIHPLADKKQDQTGFMLAERLISSLVMEDILPSDDYKLSEDEDEDVDPIVTDEIERKYLTRTVDGPDEIVGFEERLKRELRYAGLFTDEDVDWNTNEDDEICAELRELGREFKEQVKINDERKQKLLEVVDCQLQYEQYRQVLDTLDNQLEQGYLKRFRPQKSKKRKSSGPKATLSENTIYAMEKHKTWVNALGHIFKDKNMNMPKSSIYESRQT